MSEPGKAPLPVRMRRVGTELARLRQECGMSGPDVRRATGIPESTLSRVESCHRPVVRDDLIVLLITYGVTREVRRAMLRLHEDAAKPGLLGENDLATSEQLTTWVALEQDADHIRNYEPFFVPGLFQTRDYAHAVFGNCGVPFTPAEVDRKVAARLARQSLLHSERRPRLCALVHQAALHQNVGGPAVMAAQLIRLANLAELPGIDIRVVPHGIGAHAGLGGSFVILDFPVLPALVHIEHKVSSVYFDDRAQVNRYKVVFNEILAVARGVRESAALIRHTAERLSSEGALV